MMSETVNPVWLGAPWHGLEVLHNSCVFTVREFPLTFALYVGPLGDAQLPPLNFHPGSFCLALPVHIFGSAWRKCVEQHKVRSPQIKFEVSDTMKKNQQPKPTGSMFAFLKILYRVLHLASSEGLPISQRILT